MILIDHTRFNKNFDCGKVLKEISNIYKLIQHKSNVF
jgi:hypothetical protein